MLRRGTLEHPHYIPSQTFGMAHLKFRLQIIRTIPEVSLGCPHIGCIRRDRILPSLRKSRKWKMEDFSSLATKNVAHNYLFNHVIEIWLL